MLINAVIEDQQRAFCREHANAQIGILRDALAPNPGGIDHHRRMQVADFTAGDMAQAHAIHRVARAQQAADFVAGKDFCTVLAGIKHIAGGQAEGVDSAVRHAHRADKLRVDARLHAPGFLWANGLRGNPGADAGLNEVCLVAQIVFRQGDK